MQNLCLKTLYLGYLKDQLTLQKHKIRIRRPSILKDYGYTSAVFHGNNGSFWNRNVIYKSFGFDKFFDASYYNTGTSEDMAEYGLLDKPFFEQSQNL